MLGAIAGDIIGSVYEGKKKWLEVRTAHFQPLFAARARFTDDTVLTVAVADFVLHGGDLGQLLKQYYAAYPRAGYGRDFKRWAASDDEEPYGSWGNGSAMRVSPVGFAYPTLDEVLTYARETARVTHNHPEGVKGAQATAAAIYLARTGSSKAEIQDFLEQRFRYHLGVRLEEIRWHFRFDSSCQGSVPPAIIAFLDSTDFEGAVRLAVSLGGDCDTMACIAGGIAQAYYGQVPPAIREEALARLDDQLRGVVEEFEARYPAAR
jgi:ADP-ribosylglycohydrolase